MEHYFIQRQGCPRVVLFFAGWGMDWHPFAGYRPEGSDLLVCYDYRSLDFDPFWVAGYESIRLVGWSMGVWAASCLFASAGLPFADRIAVNGTPVPVDDEKGIPRRIYEGTTNGLDETAYRKFLRRMCGSGEALEAFLSRRPLRPLGELKEELRLIGEQAAALPASDFAWSKAIIGKRDLIFLPDNQRRAWGGSGTRTVELDVPHYSPMLLKNIIECRNEGHD